MMSNEKILPHGFLLFMALTVIASVFLSGVSVKIAFDQENRSTPKLYDLEVRVTRIEEACMRSSFVPKEKQ